MPAVERILKIFPGSKAYFLSIENALLVLSIFFNPCAGMRLSFIYSQASIFHTTVQQIEGQKVPVVEVAESLKKLKFMFQER